MMPFDERFARITCSCGAIIQVLKEVEEDQDGELVTYLDWDEEATAAIYQEHLPTCPDQLLE